jgi:MFS family permease
MSIFFFIAGAALLILGRKLFWLFAAVIGFLLGMSFAQQVLPGQSQTVQLIVAFVFGGLGAVLAIMVQKIAIGLAGFIAGAYLVNILVPTFSITLGSFLWIAVIVGGIIGALLASTMFDWALIFLSSAVGASVIVNHLTVPQPFPLVLLLSLLLLGVVIQAKIKSTE